MPGISGALDIARWTLYSSQLAIEVTSHNIANANTEGYSRQKLQIESNNPITMGPGQIGTGARGTEVTRAYDAFINEQVTLKQSQYNYWQAESDAMQEIETIFNESDGYGLNQVMAEFWNAWGDLSDNPDGIPERESLLARTDNLTQLIGGLDYNLREYQRHLDSSIQGSVNKINTLVEQIAGLNKQISSVEIKGLINANDLRDRRDLLLGELSEYMDISYYEEETTGQVMVYILGGTPLVLGKDTYNIDILQDATTGFSNLIWRDQSGRTVDITDKLKGGKLAGWVDVRDNKIGTYIDSMNALAEELVWQVNSLHSEGVGLQSVGSLAGSVRITAPADDLSTDFLFSDRYNAGGLFDIVVYNSSGAVANTYTINPGGNTVAALMARINAESAAGGGELTASLTGGGSGYFQIQAGAGNTFVIKPNAAGSSNTLAIMGVNSFFTWAEESGLPTTDLEDITQTLGLNSALKANSQLIAAAHLDSNNSVASGNNEVALAIASIQDKVIPGIGGTGISTTIDSYYSSFIARIGVDVENAELNEKFNDSLLNQYIQRKEGITGINLDEEMANILKFQRLYQAAAKLISVCDEMMQSLLSIK